MLISFDFAKLQLKFVFPNFIQYFFNKKERLPINSSLERSSSKLNLTPIVMKYGTNINTFVNTIQKKDALFATNYATKHLKLNSKKKLLIQK
jgi:hypothetical protein